MNNLDIAIAANWISAIANMTAFILTVYKHRKLWVLFRQTKEIMEEYKRKMGF